jgi:hypothetical protein
MATVGVVLWVLGLLAGIVGGLWLVAVAFQESVPWGLGCLFVPLVGVVFAIMHWEDAAKPFVLALGGGVAMGLGSALGGPTF